MRLQNHGTRLVTDVVLNQNYDSDIKYTIQHTRWLLQLLGVWPMISKNPKKIEIYRSIILIVLYLIGIGILVVPCTFHAIFREKDLIVSLMLFGPMGYFIIHTIKYCIIIFRSHAIKLCIEHIETDWKMIVTENDRTIMRSNVRVGRGFTALSGIFVFMGGVSYHAMIPLWRGSTLNELNETIRPLVYPGYDMFVDSQSSPNYEIIFYTTCLSASVVFIANTGSCNLVAIFVTHACGQINLIIYRLETLFDSPNNNDDDLSDRLGIIIKYHVRVLRFTSIIEKTLCEICFVEVVASTLIICLVSYCCVMDWDNCETFDKITYFEFILSLCFNIFIFCHIGELLKEQCYQIGQSTYLIDWYKLSRKNALPLIMVIAMANCPRKITAGRMMELSIQSFGAIIRTSVAYLNMLRRVTE